MGNQDDRKYLYDHQLVINMSTWCHKYYRSPSTCYCLKQSFSCSINDSLSKYFEIYFRFYPNVIRLFYVMKILVLQWIGFLVVCMFTANSAVIRLLRKQSNNS